MNRTQKKKTASLMRIALGTERTILEHKGHLAGVLAIDEYLKTADEDSLVRFADILSDAATKANSRKRV